MKFNSDNLNIHELAIEEPEKKSEVFFDFEKEITEEDWGEMEKNMQRLLDDANYNNVPWVAMNMKIIRPDYEPKFDWRVMQKITADINIQRELGEWRDFFSLAMEMKFVDPNYNSSIAFPELLGIKRELEKCKNKQNWDNFSAIAMQIKIIDPINCSDFLGLDSNVWDSMFRSLKNYKDNNMWNEFVNQATHMKVIDPKIDLDISESDWDNIRKKINFERNLGRGISFSNLVARVKILAAEKLEVTDKGLEITMPKQSVGLQRETPAIPEQKQF
ncbi:MAG: hypothetical protein A2360_04845 [Candidatus Staskawiczbacteria bacterium RIFOXYB1_FULL_32_11]|uniref:Uncharacterized protein n=1 Tax=Candidatus Staskawiczbacteria bacterium RIFOXYD1_FULL_32_13 TaxID=1802234 RepID=A0A1G2JKS2_9BACT|nr:MAG: hypothetical protein UR22_C0001G0023 [Parcubacteria group bacterium GW2011_GWC2_32_10]OGZ79745.1 MAG: hypothetical protein A2360_04845 [Candidatus Staskawiczbacteria bacterium RIFOXYB1_FULL_32_11]OGZ81036.1 MAG: hypothetical protein A2256_04265 [Candidatus Staskawiczbacteria bacterium RIFOXYA2_FULL_32_7]OGZ87662.1 MAG: hypothetical protein A2561_03115 [Candidatus Staskawiczbacteria bacterium RIFOXYD1_FULL_32_13]